VTGEVIDPVVTIVQYPPTVLPRYMIRVDLQLHTGDDLPDVQHVEQYAAYTRRGANRLARRAAHSLGGRITYRKQL
jgi:hypothetical protein